MTDGEHLRRGVVAGKADAITRFKPAGEVLADGDDLAGGGVPTAERKLPVRHGRVFEPLVAAGVHGEFGPGADGGVFGRDEDLVRGRVAQLDLAHPDLVRLQNDGLTRENFILGYEARLNPNKLGASMMVFIEVLLDRTAPDIMDTFKAAVQTRPEILECHLVAGGFDYLIKTRVADMAAYREMIASVIWSLPGVRETRTYTVMEEVKTTNALPI